jgi:hypothetical protein
MTDTERKWPSLPQGYFFRARYLGNNKALLDLRYGYGILSKSVKRVKVRPYQGDIVEKVIEAAEGLVCDLNVRLDSEKEFLRKHNAIKSIKGDTK